jgi:D-glycero-D-manno-heptose 1,7-bisphosphate phosphatase
MARSGSDVVVHLRPKAAEAGCRTTIGSTRRRSNVAAARRPAVFLDRDGTINEEVGSVLAPVDLRLLPGVAAALRSLRRAGFRLIVLTNQSCLGRGLVGEAGLAEIHDRLDRSLSRAGAGIDAIYACPHHPDLGWAPFRRRCACRKPGKGLLHRALRDFPTDLRRSFLVGDAVRDLLVARGTPIRPILVRTGKGRSEATKLDAAGLREIPVVATLRVAARRILREVR